MEMPRKKKPDPPKPRRPKGMGSIKQKGKGWIGEVREKDRPTIYTAVLESAEAVSQALDRIIGGGIDPRLLPTLQDWWLQCTDKGGPFEDRMDIETLNMYGDTIHR